jgi:excinuclease UvrABC helicase subunit UvrB
MDIVVIILGILMSIGLGYLINEWRHIDKKEKKAEKIAKDSMDRFIKYTDGEEFEYTITHTPPKGVDKQETYCINFHSTSTQGPPRRSAMTTLEDLLKIALKNENYEYAAQLRDKINKIKNSKNEDNIPQ